MFADTTVTGQNGYSEHVHAIILGMHSQKWKKILTKQYEIIPESQNPKNVQNALKMLPRARIRQIPLTFLKSITLFETN